MNYRRTGERLPIENYTGCLVGGAVGDALGAPVEFDSIAGIRSRYGQEGVGDYVEFRDGHGEFTDDTQMTLFTAEGLLLASHQASLKGIGPDLLTGTHHAYLRWLRTQGIPAPREDVSNGASDMGDGWLTGQEILHKQRAPGTTIVSALRSGKCGTVDAPINNSKGCGTVMKVAPVGLIFHGNNREAFKVGCEISAITHGHPSGYLSAGFLASVITDIAGGLSLMPSIQNAIDLLQEWRGHEETLSAVDMAVALYHHTKDHRLEVSAEEVEQLGGAWVAEEALAISLYASLLFEDDFEKGVKLAVNHSGDSDSTGAVTGNILGLIKGYDSIPLRWKDKLQGEGLVKQVAEDLFVKVKGSEYSPDADWKEKYPAG